MRIEGVHTGIDLCQPALAIQVTICLPLVACHGNNEIKGEREKISYANLFLRVDIIDSVRPYASIVGRGFLAGES